MIVDKELFEKALKENNIIRYKKDFFDVVKSYLKLTEDKNQL